MGVGGQPGRYAEARSRARGFQALRRNPAGPAPGPRRPPRGPAAPPRGEERAERFEEVRKKIALIRSESIEAGNTR